MPLFGDEFVRLFRAYGGIGRGSLFFCYRWNVFAHERVSKEIPDEGTIYDLGSGYGIFSLYMALHRPKRTVVAVDASERRTASGIRAAKALGVSNISFAREDVFETPLRDAQGVVLNDFLHHLPSWERQQELLARACAALVPGGRLVIVDVASRPLWKFVLGWLVDHILYFGDSINYPDAERLRAFLDRHGVGEMSVQPIDAGKPYPNVLFTAVKR